MSEWVPRGVILLLLGVILGVPLVLGRGSGHLPVDEDGERLIVITPHNEQIRYEFAAAFNRWRMEHGLPPVTFDWRGGGGTSDLRRMVLDEYTARARQGTEDQGIGLDLFFGGGTYEHDKLAGGVTVERDGVKVKVAATQPIELPEGLLKQAFPEPTIGGEPLYDPRLSWVAGALSSFGIVYNRDILAMIGAAPPTVWQDLDRGEYQGWLAMSDPGHSGSIAATYNTIIRRLGWTEGWSVLRRIFANARYFTSSSSKVPVDVSSGEAAAGMCIDFYGRYQAGAIGGDRVGYVDPPLLTAITADPISILRGAPHGRLANEFVVWLLSPDAQALWQRRVGVPQGPQQFELRRLPVRRDLYTRAEQANWSDPEVTPFDIAKAFPPGMPDFYGTVAPVAHALAIDVHADLVKAWRTILASPEHPQRKEMKRLFDAMPEPLTLIWPDDELERHWATILADPKHPRQQEAAAVLGGFVKGLYGRWKEPGQQLRDRLDWTLFFRGNYRRIVELGRSAS